MPKVVDHDERRAEILAAASRVIARHGLESATVRRIAAEAGYSAGVLDHYFRGGKDKILLEALQASHQRINDRLRARLRGLRGLAAVRAMLADNLPVDQVRLHETLLEMQFWARSLGDPSLAAVQVEESARFRRTVRRYLSQAVEDGELAGDLDVSAAAEALVAMVDGISAHAAVDPARMPERTQLALLDRTLDGLRN